MDFLLAYGQTGVNWYLSCGYPTAKVFPYAYVVESPAPPAPPERETDIVQLAFVGSLVEVKGTEVLISALARLAHLRWQLQIIGEGPKRRYLERLIARGGLRSRVHFHGILPMPLVAQQVAGCDLLVLPSHYDGWGAVVNEALMVGVPVICSNQCGAADLLCASVLGSVFKAGSVVELAHALEGRISTGLLPAEPRQTIRALAAQINGQLVADYLLAILSHIYQGTFRPTPPWHGTRPDNSQ